MENTELINGASGFDTAIYSSWVEFSYGVPLMTFALYKTLEQLGRRPVILQRPKEEQDDNNADKESILRKFVYDNMRCLEIFDNSGDMNVYKGIRVHISGADIVWDRQLLNSSLRFLLQANIPDEHTGIRIETSFGDGIGRPSEGVNEYYFLLQKFDEVLAFDEPNRTTLEDYFNIKPHIVLDPVFLCGREIFEKCAGRSEAAQNDKNDNFIFVSIEDFTSRKREFVLYGNRILLQNKGSLFRAFGNMKAKSSRDEESGFELAAHVCIEDYLYYLSNSEFVFADNLYAMYLAIVFKKPFAVFVNKEDAGLFQFREFLKSLGLEERLVILQDDFKDKEYLFRKPINYQRVDDRLEKMRAESIETLNKTLVNNAMEEH